MADTACVLILEDDGENLNPVVAFTKPDRGYPIKDHEGFGEEIAQSLVVSQWKHEPRWTNAFVKALLSCATDISITPLPLALEDITEHIRLAQLLNVDYLYLIIGENSNPASLSEIGMQINHYNNTRDDYNVEFSGKFPDFLKFIDVSHLAVVKR